MNETQWAVHDEELEELWAAAIGAAGGTVLGARTTYVDAQRTVTTVGASVDVAWPDGRRSTETLGASTSPRAREALRMSDGVHEIGVWRFPHDPALPGLARAFDTERMRVLLAGLGLAAEDVRLSVRAYRPLRRAVIEVRTPRTSVFVKVLRPQRVEAVHRLHRAAGGRTPESLGWTGDGLLVLAGLGGRSLRRILLTGDPDGLDPAELVTVLRDLPAAFTEHAVRPGWADKARHYADVVARVLPGAAATAHRIADTAGTPSGEPPVPVHGDFYETQLLVTGGSFTGLLDLDTAGAGDRYDDPACLLGHLAVLAQAHPDRAAVIDRFTTRCLREFDRHWDPALLRTRAGAVVLSLAPGAHRVRDPDWRAVLEQRLELADRWCRGEELLAA